MFSSPILLKKMLDWSDHFFGCPQTASSADVLKQTQIYTDEGEERDLQDASSVGFGRYSKHNLKLFKL